MSSGRCSDPGDAVTALTPLRVHDDTTVRHAFRPATNCPGQWLAAFALSCCLLHVPATHAEPPPAGETGRVVGVADGDTIVLGTAHGRRRVRLFGIDAPESGQRFGTESRAALADMVMGKTVSLRAFGTDRYGRVLGVVRRGGTDVNLVMVRLGWAWHAVRYDRRRPLRDAQRAARAAKRGLWADDRPVPPWSWRRGELEAEVTSRLAR